MGRMKREQFMDQELLVDHLVKASHFQVRLFDVDDRHLFLIIIASDGERLQPVIHKIPPMRTDSIRAVP